MRGEVWLVDFDPTQGSEIQKKRPAIVISSDGVGKLAVKLVVPLTHWDDSFKGVLWHVQVRPDGLNGLTQIDSADILQLRCVSLQRFDKCLGRISQNVLAEIAAAIAAVVEYE